MRTLNVSPVSRIAGSGGAGTARECRSLPQLELRQEASGQTKLRGYASVFNQLSQPLPFRERVLPGAFKNSISNDVRALVGHNPSQIIGRSKNSTLELREDLKGLYIEITPPATSLGKDTIENVRRGDFDQMSFGFRTITDQWKIENKEEIRELVEVDLIEVSIVSFAAYPQTSVSVRSAAPSAARDLIAELEKDFGTFYSKQPGEVREHEGIEFSDRMREEQPPAALKEAGVTSVRRDFRGGKETVVFGDGRRETRSMPTSASRAIAPRSKYREILEKAEARVKAFERKEQLRQAEARQASRRPLTPSERWATIRALEEKYGLTDDPDSIEPFTSQEVERFKDNVIAKPPDYDLRYQAWINQEKREIFAKMARIKERQREKEELQASRGMVARII